MLFKHGKVSIVNDLLIFKFASTSLKSAQTVADKAFVWILNSFILFRLFSFRRWGTRMDKYQVFIQHYIVNSYIVLRTGSIFGIPIIGVETLDKASGFCNLLCNIRFSTMIFHLLHKIHVETTIINV